MCLIFVAHAQITPRDSMKLRSDSASSISSKKNHFSVAEKQKFISDSTNKNNRSQKIDSISLLSDSSSKRKSGDSSSLSNDTTHFKLANNALDAPIKYSAEDSAVMHLDDKVTITLYGKKAVTNYKDNELTAPVITYEQSTGDIIASIKRDSSGKVISLPTFKQADFTSQSDSIRFNMKSGKGLTKSTYTQQGEMYVYAKVIKKVNDNVFYALRGRFTTCNLDTPHFAFVSNRIKFINNKVAISGPVHPEFEGVPIPIYFPFGIYPLSQGRHSGLLAPNFTTSEQRGIGLEGLGYYKVISDNWDVIFRTSFYSYGGYSFNVSPRYMKRYRYTGNFSVDTRHFNVNFKGDPDLIAEAISIHFKEDFLGNTFLQLPEIKPIVELFKNAEQGILFKNVSKPLRQAIIDLNNETDFNKTHQFIGILHQLATHDNFRLLASIGYMASLNLEESKLSNTVIAYIFKNFNQGIDLHTVAELVNMNPSAFSRSFKRVHRKTFSKYVNEIRIGYACKLLMENELNVAAIAYESGFNNLSNFNRQFKIIKKMTPSVYLKKHSNYTNLMTELT